MSIFCCNRFDAIEEHAVFFYLVVLLQTLLGHSRVTAKAQWTKSPKIIAPNFFFKDKILNILKQTVKLPYFDEFID